LGTLLGHVKCETPWFYLYIFFLNEERRKLRDR